VRVEDSDRKLAMIPRLLPSSPSFAALIEALRATNRMSRVSSVTKVDFSASPRLKPASSSRRR